MLYVFVHVYEDVRTYGVQRTRARGTYMHTRVYVRARLRTTMVVCCVATSDRKEHTCTENHVCVGRIQGSQVRGGASAGQHTPAPTLTTTASTARFTYTAAHVRTRMLFKNCLHVDLRTYSSTHNLLSARPYVMGSAPLAVDAEP